MSQTVVITGASAGIGLELSKCFRAEGFQVLNIDQNAEGEHAFSADVSNESALNQVVENILRDYGKPSFWINNAGISGTGAFGALSSEEFEKVIQVNFLGVIHGTRAAIRMMKEPESGTIVNISSVTGEIPTPFMAAYTASKHAVTGFTRALREELKQQGSGLRMVLVSPGFAKTAIMQPRHGMEFPKWMENMVADPHQVAKEIFEGLVSKDRLEELYPTGHAKAFIRLAKFSPQFAIKGSRVFSAKNWKEFLGFKPIGK